MSAFTSIQGESTSGPGQERQLASPTAHHTMCVFTEGPPTSCVVHLEGSHDGYLWVRIATLQSPTGGVWTTPPTSHLMTWIRANLYELTGDGNQMVTVTIASADD